MINLSNISKMKIINKNPAFAGFLFSKKKD